MKVRPAFKKSFSYKLIISPQHQSIMSFSGGNILGCVVTAE